MLIQSACQYLISIVTLFGVRITALDTHFLHVKHTEVRSSVVVGASSATFLQTL